MSDALLIFIVFAVAVGFYNLGRLSGRRDCMKYYQNGLDRGRQIEKRCRDIRND
jgi:hypothetical protein